MDKMALPLFLGNSLSSSSCRNTSKHLNEKKLSRLFLFFNFCSDCRIKQKIGRYTKPSVIDSTALYGLLLTL